MQLKFILRRDDGSRAQLAVTADATASVADLAAALAVGDPERRGHQPPNPTLKLEQSAFDAGARGRVLDPRRSLLDSGMRSGCTVSLAGAQPAVTRSRRGRSVAVLRVLSGPDAGREFSLPAGNSTIGTAVTSDVMLTDPAIADVHAVLTVGESIEVSSLVGPSGVLIGARAVQRGSVGATEELHLANTTIAVLPISRAGSADSDSAAIEFNRSPRVVTRFPERVFAAPTPPQRPEPAHFPVISMLLPLVMGLALFAVTRSLLGVVFIALSPLLMAGMYLDTKFQTRKKHTEAVRRFSVSVQEVAADVTAAQRVEAAVRLSEAPALAEVVDAIHRLGPLLWTHRPEHPEFLTLRVGLGDAPSRCRIELANGRDAEPQHIKQLIELCDEFAQVNEVPIVADLRECGSLGVCGPRGLVDGVARGLVMQLVGLHSPAELTITAFSSAQSRPSWEWLEWLPHAGSVYSPIAGNHLTASPNGGIALLSRLEDLVKHRDALLPAETQQTFGVIDEADGSHECQAWRHPARSGRAGRRHRADRPRPADPSRRTWCPGGCACHLGGHAGQCTARGVSHLRFGRQRDPRFHRRRGATRPARLPRRLREPRCHRCQTDRAAAGAGGRRRRRGRRRDRFAADGVIPEYRRGRGCHRSGGHQPAMDRQRIRRGAQGQGRTAVSAARNPARPGWLDRQ